MSDVLWLFLRELMQDPEFGAAALAFGTALAVLVTFGRKDES